MPTNNFTNFYASQYLNLNTYQQSAPSPQMPQNIESISIDEYMETLSTKRKVKKKNNETIKSIFGITYIQKHKSLVKKQFGLEFKDSLHFGIEIELEKTDFDDLPSTPIQVKDYEHESGTVVPFDPIYLWGVCRDGSLRNNGAEFVSSPIPYNLVEKALDSLFIYLNKNDPHAEATERCGTHIHFDCSNLTTKQVINIILWYYVLEDLFYAIGDKNREYSNFCSSIDSSKYALNLPFVFYKINSLLTTPPDIDVGYDIICDFIHGWKKYSALNILPIKKYGTLEFRHFPGTTNPDAIHYWVDCIKRFYDFCSRFTIEQTIEILSTFRSSMVNSWNIEEIFVGLSAGDFRKSIQEKARTIKLLLLTSSPEYHTITKEELLGSPLANKSLFDNLSTYIINIEGMQDVLEQEQRIKNLEIRDGLNMHLRSVVTKASDNISQIYNKYNQMKETGEYLSMKGY